MELVEVAHARARSEAGAGAHRRQRRQLHRRLFPHRAVQGRPADHARQRRRGRRWRRSARTSPKSRRATASPMPWRAARTPSTRWCPRRMLVKIPDARGFPDRRGRHAAGHDRALPDALHLPAEERRHLPGACRRGRRGRADRADGEDAGRARVRHRLDRGEGRGSRASTAWTRRSSIPSRISKPK